MDTNNWNRRQALSFMGSTGVAIASLGSMGVGRADAAQDAAPTAVPLAEMKDTRATHIEAKLQQLAPNVFAYVQAAGAGQSSYFLSNSGVIAGKKALLAVDATGAPVQAANFLAAATKATGKRFDRVVMTHSHPDHTLGAPLLGDVDIIAQEQTRATLQAQLAQPKPAIWNEMSGWATGREKFTRPLPNVSYTDRMRLHDYASGGVVLFWPGRAHTKGDTIVHLVDEKIAFIGDIGFFNVTPLNGNGYVADWIKTCDRLLALDIDVFVPGHGPVGGKNELSDMRDYLALIFAEAKKKFEAGVTAGRAAAEMPLGKYRNWVDAERVVTNVVRLYSEFDGSITPGLANLNTLLKAQQEFEALQGRSR